MPVRYDPERKIYLARMVRMQERDELAVATDDATRRKFFSRVRVTDGCHFYEPASQTGYGVFGYEGERMQAHRYALLIAVGLPPKGGVRYACHKCENKNCVRPEHLYWGTPAENIVDAWADPRNRTEEKRLAAKYAEKLTDEQIRDIWRRFYYDSHTLSDLASEYQANARYLSQVLKGVYRTHITRHLMKPAVPRKVACGHKHEKHGRTLFTNEQVQTMRKLMCNGVDVSDIAILMDCKYPTIQSIRTGRTWNELPWPEGCAPLTAEQREKDLRRSAPSGVRAMRDTRPRADITDAELCEIHREFWEGNGNSRAIAVARNIHHGLISFIVNRKYKPEVTAHLPQPPRKKVVTAARPIGTGKSILKPDQVQEIRLRILSGEPDRSIMADYPRCTINMVADIRLNKSWKKLPWPETK